MANCSQTNNTTIIGTSAVSYDSTPLPCTDVKACDDLNTILTKFDDVICSAVASVNTLTEEVTNITEDLMIITEEIENINNQIFICCPICDFTITATELPVCDFTVSANQLPDPTTTTTSSSSTSTSTSTSTTTSTSTSSTTSTTSTSTSSTTTSTTTVALIRVVNDIVNEPQCRSSVTVTVSPQVKVKVDILETFIFPATWNINLPGGPGVTLVTSNLTNNIINAGSSKIYNYGIESTKSFDAGDTSTSIITLTVKNFITNAVISTYVFTRISNPALSLC